MTDHTSALMLVLGGTGKTGRRVVQRLTAQGEQERIGSRSGGLPFAVRRRFDEARWSAWNLVRTLTTTAAFGCLIAGGNDAPGRALG